MVSTVTIKYNNFESCSLYVKIMSILDLLMTFWLPSYTDTTNSSFKLCYFYTLILEEHLGTAAKDTTSIYWLSKSSFNKKWCSPQYHI
jgi:hypothetical protein